MLAIKDAEKLFLSHLILKGGEVGVEKFVLYMLIAIKMKALCRNKSTLSQCATISCLTRRGKCHVL